MSFKFYLMIEDRFDTTEFMSERTEHMKTFQDIFDYLNGDDCNPVSILEITDDCAPNEVIEDVALAYLAHLQEAADFDHDHAMKYNAWMAEYIDEDADASFDWRTDEGAQYRASVL